MTPHALSPHSSTDHLNAEATNWQAPNWATDTDQKRQSPWRKSPQEAGSVISDSRPRAGIPTASDAAVENGDAPGKLEQAGFESRRGNGVAFLASLFVHVALLVGLACCVLTAGRNSKGLMLSASVGEPTETSLIETETFELSLDAAVEPELAMPEPEFLAEMELENPFEKMDTGVGEPIMASVSKENVLRELETSRKRRGASFFGAYAEGRRFIYVLDSSRSMTGDRWQYACAQLLDSLGGLNPDQEFYVICFDAQTTFLFNRTPKLARYYEANNTTVSKVRNWLRSRTLGSATMPAVALQYAIDFDPDAIFLLSDGELQDNSRGMLRRINSNVSSDRQIPIHTVHLFSAVGKQTLEQIAKENGGTFTAVQPNTNFGRFRSR